MTRRACMTTAMILLALFASSCATLKPFRRGEVTEGGKVIYETFYVRVTRADLLLLDQLKSAGVLVATGANARIGQVRLVISGKGEFEVDRSELADHPDLKGKLRRFLERASGLSEQQKNDLLGQDDSGLFTLDSAAFSIFLEMAAPGDLICLSIELCSLNGGSILGTPVVIAAEGVPFCCSTMLLAPILAGSQCLEEDLFTILFAGIP